MFQLFFPSESLMEDPRGTELGSDLNSCLVKGLGGGFIAVVLAMLCVAVYINF